jgi:hypothetical protein
VVEAQRDDIALYTGNDDNIVADLLTPFPVHVGGRTVTRRLDAGLLGQWAVWTRSAVELFGRIQATRAKPPEGGDDTLSTVLTHGAALTDANGAIFDVANEFAGCIPGIHEVLRRQGLLAGTWCLDPAEVLSPNQAHEITRVARDYPSLVDDEFVRANLDAWMA